jgi:carbamoyltransferase
MKTILGISAYYHDSAVCLIIDGKIAAAVQEERFTRIKHDDSFPVNGIKYVLNEFKLSLNQLDAVVFYEKPFIKFERLIETYLSESPLGFSFFFKSLPIWIKEKLFQKKLLIDSLKKIDLKFDKSRLKFSEHHYSHAASAFFPSPYEEAIILIIDGVGEWSTTSLAIGRKNKIKMVSEINFPHSLGLLYSAFTYYLGFKVNSGEYKVMGLAPYGIPKYSNLILKNIIDLKDDGSFRLNMKYFNYTKGLTMTNDKFNSLFKVKNRNSNNERLNQFHMDVAASLQNVLEFIILKLTKNISEKYSIKNLCLAGGVALNCVTNGKILKQKLFDNIWIQPASGDAGGSVGAAYAFWYNKYDSNRVIMNKDSMEGSYLGPSYSESQIKKDLEKLKAKYQKLKYDEILKVTAKELANGKAVGWFQGRMEFGPRALGNRSIIADPRNINMQKNLNLKVKYRESFRPFAPAILREKLEEWFDLSIDSPYMLQVSSLLDKHCLNMSDEEKKLFGIDKLNIKRSTIPAITHVDYSARIQTVHKETNDKFYSLIEEFNQITNCPILVNTSFNVRGEPIVCTPEDAFKCFMGTNLDILVVENFIMYKENQVSKLSNDYKNEFELD